MLQTNSRTTPPRMSLSVLDALRGLAALYVMLSHARWFLWATHKEYLESGQHGFGTVLATLSASLDYSHHAVLLFFLLSGFCIHYRQATLLSTANESLKKRKLLDIRSFARRRIKRLYPALLVALVLTAILDYVGLQINPGFYAGQTAYQGLNTLARPDFSLPTVIGNLLMQGGLIVPPLGNNAPLWSLAWEFWFYVLYPVVLVLSTRLRTLGMLAVVGGASVVAFAAGGFGVALPQWIVTVLTYWVVWGAGATIAEAYAGRIRLPGLRLLAPLAVALGMGVAVVLALRHVNYLNGANVTFVDPGTDLLMSAAFAVVLAFIMLDLPLSLRHRVEAVARWLAPLGDMSYSLYIVHYPWLALMSAWWLWQNPRLPLGAELAILGALTSFALGWCLWYFVERHCVSSKSAVRVQKPVSVPPTPVLWEDVVPAPVTVSSR